MSAAGEAFFENGPVLPPRGEVYRMACELQALARIAMELSCAGSGYRCHADLPRALRQFEKMRAVLGPSPFDGLNGPG